MNLEKYKAEHDLTSNDIIDLVKPDFPKFSKVTMSMVNKGTYGVVLAPKAVRALNKAHPAKKAYHYCIAYYFCVTLYLC